MKVYYDLHIHSVLSACSDVLQTPNNILNMCMLKGLNVISICDHNSSKQYETIEKLKESFDFLVIYGIEITTREGFHILAYFEKLDEVMMLDEIIDRSLNKDVITINNKVIGDDLFQIICDIYDEEDRQIPYYLNQNIGISFLDLIPIIKKLNGLLILAHIDREKTGILNYYENNINAFDLNNIEGIDGLEIYNKDILSNLIEKHPFITKYKHLFNSDAHDIDVINERVNYMEWDDLSFSSFKKWLSKTK